MHFCPQNRQKATPAPSIAHLPAMPLHCPSKLPLQALLNPPHGPCTAPSCPCTHSHALLLPPHAALQASQILYSRCTPKAAYNGWGGGSVPSLPPIGTAAPLRPAEPSAQRDAPGTVPPSPTTALPVFFHCLHILSLLFFANPKSGPIPPGDCILPHTLLPSPPPRKKKKNLWEFIPPPANPSGCVAVARVGGAAVGKGLHSHCRLPACSRCLLLRCIAPKSQRYRSRRRRRAGAAQCRDRRSRRRRSSPPLQNLPPHILSPTGTVSDSPSTPTTPAHLCAGRGLSDLFLPALKFLPPAGCSLLSPPGVQVAPPAHPQTRSMGKLGVPVPPGCVSPLISLPFAIAPLSHQCRGGCCAPGLQL